MSNYPEFSADELAAEEWRPIPGFDGYDVSSLGRVRSWRKAGRGAGKRREWPLLLSVNRNKAGYSVAPLFIGGRIRPSKKLVHGLVLLAFVGPCPDGLQTCHFPDRDPSNNRLSNLSYGTAQDNADDRRVHGTIARGERNGSSKISDAACARLRSLPPSTATFHGYASAFGLTVDQVIRIYHGQSRKQAGEP